MRAEVFGQLQHFGGFKCVLVGRVIVGSAEYLLKVIEAETDAFGDSLGCIT